MNIIIISAFRNATRHIPRYFAQVESLRKHARMHDLSSNVYTISVEGDSRDGTSEALKSRSYNTHLVTHNHGLRVFGSTEDSDRLAALTGVMIAGMQAVGDLDVALTDMILYVESDLIWRAHDVGSIIDLAYRREQGYDIIAPLIFAGTHFYDVWGFRKDGARFGPFYPYHSGLNHTSLLTEIDSAGSCLAFTAELALKVKPIGELGLVSWCNGAREMGYKIAVCPHFRVDHP